MNGSMLGIQLSEKKQINWAKKLWIILSCLYFIQPKKSFDYYASDNQEFTTTRAIQESAELIPICQQ